VTALERTLRTSPATGIRLDPLLNAVLLSELLAPSPEVWLISAWISDVSAIDNTSGDYDSMFADPSARTYFLSEVLAQLTASGTILHVVARAAEHNDAFLTRLGRRVRPECLTVIRDADVHEKTLCGRDWLLTGSMNFTLRGMLVNDEAVTYKVGEKEAAAARIDFSRRWADPR
jgi:phosphatidylserine/phosphatidylglycerophosphate/cardiolipin synthase-like enzyme